MQARALSVTDLNEYVRRSLAADPMLQDLTLRGEISNFKRQTSGHLYFSLKDENSRVACVMFRQYAQMLRFHPQDGMMVLLSGSVGLYTASGNYQFYGQAMQKDGVGVLFERFLALKDKLQKEGLFDAARKKPLPLLPRAVGVVTSSTGAVISDILTVVRRRFDNMPVILRPSLVQGEGAADAKVVARVRGPEGRTAPVEMPIVAGAAGHYQGRYTPAGAGSYTVDARELTGGNAAFTILNMPTALTTITFQAGQRPSPDAQAALTGYVVEVRNTADRTHLLHWQTGTPTRRKLGDIDGDGSVTAMDKLEMNKKLNGLYTPYPNRAFDLDGDASINAVDKLILNQILNGIPLY